MSADATALLAQLRTWRNSRRAACRPRGPPPSPAPLRAGRAQRPHPLPRSPRHVRSLADLTPAYYASLGGGPCPSPPPEGGFSPEQGDRNLAAGLGRITARVAYFAGEGDRYFPVAEAQARGGGALSRARQRWLRRGGCWRRLGSRARAQAECALVGAAVPGGALGALTVTLSKEWGHRAGDPHRPGQASFARAHPCCGVGGKASFCGVLRRCGASRQRSRVCAGGGGRAAEGCGANAVGAGSVATDSGREWRALTRRSQIVLADDGGPTSRPTPTVDTR